MNRYEALALRGFYQNELTNNLLSFWDECCVDRARGGFYNCFDNAGQRLISRDKYTWSQGRFVWMWARLAGMRGDTFTKEQRGAFLEKARRGCDFLRAHCLIAQDDWRCVFLTDEAGNPKRVEGCGEYDASIYADCFVALGFARYALEARDRAAWAFASNLYRSIVSRVEAGAYHTLPYPLSPRYRAHGVPMILSHVTREMRQAALALEPDAAPALDKRLRAYASDVLDHFVDDTGALREIIAADNRFVDGPFGRHVNPGHAIEDAWFLVEAADALGEPIWLPKIAAMASRALSLGWDAQHGGLLHFAPLEGTSLDDDAGDAEGEPLLRLVRGDRGSKLWWVHSEALYATLLLHERHGDDSFLAWHRRLFSYVFTHFPNPDRETREWNQILTREGAPQDKVVALPVKDPYHIVRNMIQLIELLTDRTDKEDPNET